MEYTGRNVVVLGLGLTGFSLARYLASRGATVRVADTRPAPPLLGSERHNGGRLCAAKLDGRSGTRRPSRALTTGRTFLSW